MSANLVHKALEIVDSEYSKNSKGGKNRKKENAFNLMSDSEKFTKVITKNGRKEKVRLMTADKKLTVTEAKKLIKTDEEILKINLKKSKAIKKASFIDLDKETTDKIIERAVTGRPVKKTKRKKKPQKTAFTEDDFKKFEEEFLNS